MNDSMALVLTLIKKLIVLIFEKYEVNKKLESLGFDVSALLNGTSEPKETDA